MQNNNFREQYIEQAWSHLDQLTKPPRSLGRVEEVAAKLCGIQKTNSPQTKPRSVIVFAGDHGVCEEKVSAFPQQVTIEMMKNMASGGAAVSVLAKLHQCHLRVIDVGSMMPSSQTIDGIERRLVRNGTRNFTIEPAMTMDEMNTAIQTGRDAVIEAINKGMRVLILGEMGIGNTTSAAAMASALLHVSPIEIAGRGTGLDEEGLRHKTGVIQQSIDFHQHQFTNAESILACLGGYEIAAMTGAMLAAAKQNIPIFLDGFIVSAAALAASKMQPDVVDCMIASHVSTEPGHKRILAHMNLQPLLDLSLRLGEASGALIALPILDSAVALYNEMATFDSAGVSAKSP